MATLQYDFRVVGLNSVMAAFRSLEQRALQHNRTISRAFGTPQGGGAGGVRGTGGLGPRGPQHDAHVHARKRFLKQQETDERRAQNALSQLRQQEIRDQDRHAREQVNIARRMERERRRNRDREAREAYRERRRVATQRYEAGVGALTSLGSRAAGLISLGGGAAIAAGVSSELKTGKSAALLAGLSKQAGNKGNIKTIQQGITEQARLVGKATGADRESIIQTMTSFFSVSGNLDTAKELSGFFVDMSQITGASMQDVGALAGDAFFQGMLSNMSPADAKKATEQIVRTLAGHSALGSINFEDYVKTGKSLMSTSGRFGGDLAGTVGLVSAIAQTTPGGGANSAAEAATAVARFADALPELSKKRGSFEKMGVQAFEENQYGVRVLRNPIEVIRDVLKKTKGGSEEELVKFGFNIRARKAVTGFQRLYREAGGGDAGMQAIEAHLDRFAKANVSPEIQKEVVANLRATPAMQFEAAFNDLKAEIGQSLLPALTQLAPAMSKLVVALKPLIDWLGRFAQSAVENPWGTIIEAVSLALVGSVAKAAIGEAVKAQIIKLLIGTGGIPLPGTPGTPGVPGIPPVVPGGAGSSLFGGFLSRAAGLVAIATLGGDRASETAFEEQDRQNLAEDEARRQFREKGTISLKYQRSASEWLPFVKENVTEDLREIDIDRLTTAGIIKPQDFVNQFGKEGAQRLGLLSDTGELPSMGNMSKVVADQNKAAADAFQKAVGVFAEAASQLGGPAGGGLFNTLFGGLNRGTSPSAPDTSSQGSR